MNEILDYYFHTTLGWIEIAATIFLLISVYQAVTQNIWTWVWGAIGVTLFGYLVYNFQLYSDAALQFLFFLPLQVVGWYWWMKKGPKANNDLPVTSLAWHKSFALVVFIFAMTMLTGSWMQANTDASFPYADALTTWMSIVAQVLMIKKIWESWPLWVAMDAIAINIYFQKELYVTSGLYVIFFVLAIMGLVAWYKALDNKPSYLGFLKNA